ncbi:MAG: hypothetical protein QXN63_00195 [Candidatus Bathyarchaeia archaeon]
MPLKLFKPKEAEVKTEVGTLTDLEKLCADDKEAYEALKHAMPLDPRKIKTTLQEATENAKKFEKEGNTVKARWWYMVAGELAIYEGDVSKVKQIYGKLSKLTPNVSYPILEVPERAVKKAQEYYQKFLK